MLSRRRKRVGIGLSEGHKSITQSRGGISRRQRSTLYKELEFWHAVYDSETNVKGALLREAGGLPRKCQYLSLWEALEG